MAESRFERVLAPSGMEATIETATQILTNPDSSKEEKYSALPMLGCSQDDRNAQNLIAALDDPERDIRGGAIIAMRYLNSELTFPALIEVAINDVEDEGMRELATGTLSQIGGENVDVALAVTIAARDTSQRPSTRFNHVFSLGRLTSAQSVSSLHTFLDDGDSNVAASAAVALAQHEIRASIPYLVQAILSPTTEYWMKMKAVRELENLTGRAFEFSDLGNTYVKELYEAAQAEVYEWYEAKKQEFM